MNINGFRYINGFKIPFVIDSMQIGFINPWRSNDYYKTDGGDRLWANGQEIHILLNVNGRDFTIGGCDYVFINGVPIQNDRTENAVKIIEYIQTIMLLERKDPPMELLQENIIDKL